MQEQEINMEDLDLPIMPRGQMGFNDRANLVEQTDPERLINDIRHVLSGDIKNDLGDWIKIDDTHPFINEFGINKITIFLRMVINKNTIFTKYSSEEINKILIDITTDINDHMRANAREYGVIPQNYGLVVDMVVQPIEAAINRSREGVTMDFIGNATKDINTNAQRDMPMAYAQQRPNILQRVLKPFSPFK